MARDRTHEVEQRAVAVAREVSRGCGHGDHHDGCGHSALQRQPEVSVSQPSDPAERLADAAADRLDAGLPATTAPASRASRSADTVAQALRPAGPGRALARGLRQAGEASLGADLSGVRVHDDPRADALSRHLGADGFTVGRDMYFRQGVYGSSSPAQRHVVHHEMAHAGQGGGDGAAIARHASWEHRMLGDVDPSTLEVIAAGRDLVAERKKERWKWNKSTPTKTIQAKDKGGQERTVNPTDVLHAIEQEIERQRAFATMKPTSRRAGKTGKNQVIVMEDNQETARWDVHILNIPLRDGTVAALTYGEMNTLGDFYGSPEEIGQTDPQQFVNYLYGIREEGLRKFMRLHTEIAEGTGEKAIYKKEAGAKKTRVKDEEARSKGNVGTGDISGELKLMGAVPVVFKKDEKKKLAKNQSGEDIENTGYTGGLGRNACHFAPQSWHAWSSYHQKAKTLAGQAWTKRELAKATVDDEQRRTLEEEASEKQNEALVQNGFGDHFLQDSYASGHLINKTLIMQWFTKWLDEHPLKRDFTKNESWQAAQNIAYNQPKLPGKALYDTPLKEGQASDAQSVDNMQGSWRDRFSALGLEIPKSVTSADAPSGKLLLGWQNERRFGDLKKTDVKEIKSQYAQTWGLSDNEVEGALVQLIDDGVVRYSNYSTGDRKKGAKEIGLTGVFGAKTLELTARYQPKSRSMQSSEDRRKDKANLGKRAQKSTYQDYMTFLNHGYLQLSTNMLHNYFCENGLVVKSAAETLPYKIYGDNAMLQKESSKGVRFSAETSNMSRDAIYDWATTGETANSTAAIEARLPKEVQTKDGSIVTLADWHGDTGALHQLCWDKVFPDTAAVFSKSSVIFLTDEDLVAGKKSEKIMKDVKALNHEAEGF